MTYTRVKLERGLARAGGVSGTAVSRFINDGAYNGHVMLKVIGDVRCRWQSRKEHIGAVDSRASHALYATLACAIMQESISGGRRLERASRIRYVCSAVTVAAVQGSCCTHALGVSNHHRLRGRAESWLDHPKHAFLMNSWLVNSNNAGQKAAEIKVGLHT